MGSSRFPNKMLQKLGPHTILEWVLYRVARSKKIDRLMLVTSFEDKDNELVASVEKLGISIFRGSEHDVLERFAFAASNFSTDYIVRICADNPFVDPNEIDRLILEFLESPCDYACNHRDSLGSNYADGFGAEILSNNLLQKLNKIATEDSHREHVTLYLWDNAHSFKIRAIKSPKEIAFPKLRFDVDTLEDFNYLKQLISMGVRLDSTAAEIVSFAKNAKLL
jgi:spore coat polysaccharide biosynthesis protein SpsF